MPSLELSAGPRAARSRADTPSLPSQVWLEGESWTSLAKVAKASSSDKQLHFNNDRKLLENQGVDESISKR